MEKVKKILLNMLLMGAISIQTVVPVFAQSEQKPGDLLYQNDFESSDLSSFEKDDVAGYATKSISEVVDNGDEHGKVWKVAALNDQGLSSMAYSYRTKDKYNNFSIKFDMKTNAAADDDKPMIAFKAEDGKYYIVAFYNDRISIGHKPYKDEVYFTSGKITRGSGWNKYEIKLNTAKVSVFMNNELVVEASLEPMVNTAIEFNGWRHTSFYDNIVIQAVEPEEIPIPNPVDFILNHKKVQLSIGDAITVSPIYENLSDKKSSISYSSSDETVATVNEYGVISAKATGIAKITAIAEDGATASCDVVVNNTCHNFYYIAIDGNDSTGDGSKEKPFKTIEKARDTIRALNLLPDGGITIYLREGEYYINETIVFKPEDSGEAGKPIVYASYPNEQATIHSGKKLTFKKLAENYPKALPESSRGNVFVAEVEPGWRFHDIYVNGERQQVARLYNTDDWSTWSSFPGGQKTPGDQRDERGTNLIFPNGTLVDIPSNGDVEVNLLTAQWWNCLPVLKGIDIEKNTAWLESFNANWGNYWSNGVIFQNNGKFNLMNAPKFLDKPGEWCIDSQNGMVYWWPKNTSDLKNAIVPKVHELIRLQGDEENQNWERPVEYLEFRNLTFMYNDRLPEDRWAEEKFNPGIIARNAENTDAAIFMQGTENCVVADSTILCTGSYAIAIDHYGKYNRIVRNEMGNLGCGGVQLTGYGPGTKTKDINTGNTVLANYIHDTGRAPYMHSSAVTNYGSSYNDIKFNKMERLPYTAIMLTGADSASMNPKSFHVNEWFDSYGNKNTQYGIREDEIRALGTEITDKFGTNIDNGIHAVPYENSDYVIVEYNYAYDYMRDMNDGGCYYAWSVGKNNEFNFNIAEKKDNARHMCWPLYLDDWASYLKVTGNRVWAPQISTLDKGAGRNIWADNASSSDMNNAPEGFGKLKDSILGVVQSLGGYKEHIFENNKKLAPEFNGISVESDSVNENRTVITMPKLLEGAVKFVCLKVDEAISAPFVGDFVLSEKELLPETENKIVTSNGQKFAVYAFDENGGVIAYANVTAKTNAKAVSIYNIDFETIEQNPNKLFMNNTGDLGRYITGQISEVVETSDNGHGKYVWKIASGNTNGKTGLGSMAYDKECDKNLTDFALQFDMKSGISNAEVRARVRSNKTNNNGYGVVIYNDKIVIDKRSKANKDVTIATYKMDTVRGVSWHSYKIVVVGYTIEVFMDGKSVVKATDEEKLYEKGGFSLSGWGHSAYFDNITLDGFEEYIAVEKVKISKESVKLAVGEQTTLTATVLPENAMDKAIIWKISDPSVAIVENGEVTAVGEGTAVIKAVSAEDETIYATCIVSADIFKVTITPTANGTITSSAISVTSGGSIELAFTPDAGYRVKSATVNGANVTLVDGKYTVKNVQSDVTVTAEFEKMEEPQPGVFTVTIAPAVNGTITSSAISVTSGGSIELTFTPDAGYRVKSATVNGANVTLVDGKYTVTNVQSDVTVTADFEKMEEPQPEVFKVTIVQGANGTITSNAATVTSGGSIELAFTPDAGYRVKSATVNGANVTLTDGKYTVNNIQSSITVIAEFELINQGGNGGENSGPSITYYTITVTSNQGGKVSPGSATVEEKGSKTFTITSDEGYDISDVEVDGKSVGKVTTYTFNNVTGNHTLKATFKKVEVPEKPEYKNPFADINKDHWFYDSVMYVYNNGLMSGVSPDKFNPLENGSRSIIVTILYSLEGKPDAEENSFKDVENGKWYTTAITWAAENNIVSGYGNGLFGPNENITREQMAAIFYNYAKFKGHDLSEKAPIISFTDSNKVSNWANEAMQWMVGSGMMSGKGNNILDPKGTATRAEMAFIMQKFAEKYCK